MKKKDELFEKINLLNGPETRFFKLFARRHVSGKDNNYLKLFNHIRSKKAVNDNDLKLAFKKEAFVRDLPAIKYYLTRIVDEALCHYHNNNSSHSQALKHYQLAEIYHNKGYYLLAAGHIKKVRKLAEQSELFLLNLMASEFNARNFISFNPQDLKSVLQEEEKKYESTIAKYLNYKEFLYSWIRFKTLEKQVFIPQTRTQKTKYDLILGHPIFKSPANALSEKARKIYYELKTSYEDKRYEKPYTDEINEDVLDFFAKYPQMLRRNSGNFILAVYEYLEGLLHNGDIKTFSRNLTKFEKLKAPGEALNAQLTYRIGLLKLHYNYYHVSYASAHAWMEGLEKMFRHYDKSLSLPLIFDLYYEFARLLYSHEKYGKALKFILRITANQYLMPGYEIKEKAQLAILAIHFKLGNIEVLQSFLKSAKRKDNSKPGRQNPVRILLGCLVKLEKTQSRGERLMVRERFFYGLSRWQNQLFSDSLLKNALGTGRCSVFY